MAFFHAATGLATPSALRLCDLVRLLITPSTERDDLVADVPEPDLVPLPDPDVFTEEQWAHADALLDVTEVPRRLSGLLADARRIDPELPRLVTLRVLYAVSPEFGGADLLVGVARLTDPTTSGAAELTDIQEGEVA